MKKLNKVMPPAYKKLTGLMTRLEKHYKDMQDMEFTIQQKKLYILQTRTGKRTAEAAVKIAVDMVDEKLITAKEAVRRVEPEQLDRLLHPHFDPKAKRSVMTTGLPASPGKCAAPSEFVAVAPRFAGIPTSKRIARAFRAPRRILRGLAARGCRLDWGRLPSQAVSVLARLILGVITQCTLWRGE